MKLDLKEIENIFKTAEIEALDLRTRFTNISPIHKAAGEIVDFERQKFYGGISESQHLKKIREIIDRYANEINNYETN